MIELNPKRWKTEPFKHQLEGVRELLAKPAFALFDEMGSGKSKQCIDAACTLFEAGEIDCVVVVAPASVRSVWHHPERGQIRKHCWQPAAVLEYHGAEAELLWEEPAGYGLLPFFVSNYEYLRATNGRNHRLAGMLHLLRDFERIMLVLDESSFLKERTANQAKAVASLRQGCARCVELNGTPISKNPLDLWSQMNILDPKILGRVYVNYWHFRNTHCITAPPVKMANGGRFEKILGWRNLELVQELIKPYCLRRLKKDCMDLPPKIGGIEAEDPVVQYVPLSASTWRRYKELRADALLHLPAGDQVPEPNAGVRLIRLAQLTSGHVSYNPTNIEADLFTEEGELQLAENQVDDLSQEKQDWAFNFLTDWDQAEATVVWCRFRRERERLAARLRGAGVRTYEIYGGQRKAEREEAEAAFDPTARGTGRRVLLAQPQAGSLGLQLHAATENLYLSNTQSLKDRLQSEDRTHRSGTVSRVSYTDLVATGPDGQKTIDWVILKALREKQDLASWTCSRWRRALEEEF